MTVMDAQGWVMIIASIAAAGTSMITAWKVIAVQKQSLVVGSKVDEVHGIVNSQATADRAKIELLQTLLVAKQMEIESAEKARKTLAAAAAAELKKE